MGKEARFDRDSAQVAGDDRGRRSGSELEKKYPVALAMYAVLAVLVWFTVGEGSVMVMGRPVQVRLIPILILALFAFRTYVAMQADRIRRNDEKESSGLKG
jgi:hypothetical protein